VSIRECGGQGMMLSILRGSFLFTLCFLASCTQEKSASSGTEDLLIRARQERDRFFKSNPQSPIPAEARGRFQGLDYFPANPGLRFQVRLNRYPVPARLRMATNTGEVRDALKYGYFEFPAEGQICRLQVYRMEESGGSGPPYLFIPFRDATTGKESYEAGRYLELPENTSGVYDLDFNQAFNPSCAYGGDFSCPIPPEENRLAVPIAAGEKKYPLQKPH
jgi:uncharacterized protein (DUF1684 family)